MLAPIFVLAFDYGMGPKLAIVALICFFPITVNVLDGLRSAPAELLKLMRSLGASRLQTLRKVELPSALPSFFTGLRVAATVSVIGAVFGEWAGADEGLGRLVLLANNQLQTPRAYAGIVLLTLMAVGALRARDPRRPAGRAPGTERKRTHEATHAARCSWPSRPSRRPAAARRRTCSEPEGSKRVELMLDYFPNADHAGDLRRPGGRPLRGGRASTWRSASRPTRRRRSSSWRPGGWTWRSPTSPRCCAPATRG